MMPTCDRKTPVPTTGELSTFVERVWPVIDVYGRVRRMVRTDARGLRVVRGAIA